MLFLGDFMNRSVLDMMLLASRVVQKLTRLRTRTQLRVGIGYPQWTVHSHQQTTRSQYTGLMKACMS